MATKSKVKEFTLKRFLIVSGGDFAEATDIVMEGVGGRNLFDTLNDAKDELEDRMNIDGDDEGVVVELTMKFVARAEVIPSEVKWD